MMLRCPIRGCDRGRKEMQVMCGRHWYRVSAATRRRVWAEFRADPGSSAHLEAIDDAMREAAA